MNYSSQVLDALRNFSNGEKYQYNIDILAPHGLIATEGKKTRTSEAGIVIGWSITAKGRQVLKEITISQ